MAYTEQDLVVVAGEHFRRGRQIICVPHHLNHVDAYSEPLEELLVIDGIEFGFVDRLAPDGKAVFCRYWSKYNPGELRTQANSESTPIQMLRWRDTHTEEEVSAAVEKHIYGF